jgi:tetratricopeptide (TPR) repeat protein
MRTSWTPRAKPYEEALKIRRQLAEKNPDTYLPYVAKTLNNLGNLHAKENHMGEARQVLDEALKIYQQFAARDHAQYDPYVQRVTNLLAQLP